MNSRNTRELSKPIILLVVFFLGLVGFSTTTAAAPTVDNVTTNAGELADYAFSHTVSGDNRLLVVEIALDNSDTSVDSMSYNGQSLTSIDRAANQKAAEAWYLTDPPTGTHKVHINLSKGQKAAMAALSFTEVDQDTSVDNVVTNTGKADAAEVTVTSENDDLVMDVMVSSANGGPTVGSGQTEQWNLGMAGGARHGAGSTEPGESSVVMNWTLAEANKEFSIVGFNINDFDLFPNITYTDPTPADGSFQNDTSVTFNVSVSDDEAVDSCILTFDGTNETLTTDGSTSDFCNTTKNGLSEGSHEFRIYVNDSAGQVSGETKRSFTVDTTKPNVTLNKPANDSTILQDSVDFNFTATDNIATDMICDLYIDAQQSQSNTTTFNDTLTNFNVPELSQGSHNWSVQCRDDAINTGLSETWEFFINVTPIMSSISASPDPIKGGDVINVTGNGVDDPNADTLEFFCSKETTTPTAGNTICSGGNTVDSGPQYSPSCTYATETDTSSHTVHCRVYDGEHYSTTRNYTYDTDTTPPDTTVTNVSGDTDAPYYDSVDDSVTNITVSGESGMTCRWSSSDVSYSTMTNSCDTTGSEATCSVTDVVSQGVKDRYVACQDSLGNSQNSTQNNHVQFTLDYTNPTSSFDADTAIHLPGYTTNFTESDNIDGDPLSQYCIDGTDTCSPSTAIDTAGQVSISTRGQRFLRFTSTDDASNQQGPVSNTININQLPVLTSASDNGSTVRGGSLIEITTDSNDPDTGLGQNYTLYVCDDTGANADGCTTGSLLCSNTTTLDNASCRFNSQNDDDTHLWHAYLFDNAGEDATDNPKSGSYTTDSSGPGITIIDPENISYTQTDIPVEISTSETTDTARYSLNGQANNSLNALSTTSFATTISGVSDGLHNITFWAEDAVGNWNRSGYRYFRVNTTDPDSTPPTITIRSPANNSFHADPVLFNLTTDEELSNATYSLDNGANQTMDNTSKRTWNATVTPGTEGRHTVSYWAEDLAGNLKHSVTRFFTFDTTAPQHTSSGVTPSSPADDEDVTCHSSWTDNVGLGLGVVQENATGTKQNHTIAISGTSGDVNYTIPAADVQPIMTECVFFVNDTTGNLNSTSTRFTPTDSVPPQFTNITNQPDTVDELDPGVQVNVTANVSDDGGVDTVTLQYRNSSTTTFTNTSMQSTTGTGYSGSFTPDTADNWTYRLWANDSVDNTNQSGTTTLGIANESTFTVDDTIMATTARLRTSDPVMDLGNITVNNTGDDSLDINTTADVSWISFGSGSDAFLSQTIAEGGDTSFSVTANTTDFPVGDFSFNISVNVTQDGKDVGVSYITGQVRVQSEPGPVLEVTFPEFSSAVTKGQKSITYQAQVENGGTEAASDTWLAWGLPEPFTLKTGTLNRSLQTLAIGDTSSNTITVDIKTGATDQRVEVNASTNASNAKGVVEVRNVTIGDPVTQTVVQDSGGGGGGGGNRVVIDSGSSAPSTGTQREILSGRRVLNSSSRVDIVRGENSSFDIDVSNLFENATMYNVSVDVESDGILNNRIAVHPTQIPGIRYPNMRRFTVNITSPAYVQPGRYRLDAFVTADLKGEYIDQRLVDRREITLVIHGVSKETANQSIAGAEQDIEQLSRHGHSTVEVRELAQQARQALEDREYDTAQELAQQVSDLRETAEQARERIETVHSRIRQEQTSLGKQIGYTQLFPETEALMRLAQAALSRGAFDTALQHAEQADLTFEAERDEFNFIVFLLRHWYRLLIGFIAVVVSGVLGYRTYMKQTITQTIRGLNKKEEQVIQRMKEAQHKYYQDRSLSKKEFQESMEDYRQRIASIEQERTELRHKRVRLLRPEKVVKDLAKEREQVEKQLSRLQRMYYERSEMPKKAYERQTALYKERLTEIEEEQLSVKLQQEVEGQ